MTKVHYFQRYSSLENTVTNNTLQLIARIYSYSPSQASRFLSEILEEPIDIGLEISQQERKQKAVPDGVVIQRSFKIVIESKVDSGVSIEQLIRHAACFSDESTKILVLLTKQVLDKNIEETTRNMLSSSLPYRVIFRNVTFEMICKAVTSLFKEYESEMFNLAQDYVEYCSDVSLLTTEFLRIVPCGESLVLNKRHALYFQPSDRGYSNHSYVGFYNNKVVQAIIKIDSVFDVDYDGKVLDKTLVQGRKTDDYDKRIISSILEARSSCKKDVSSGHRFFCGEQAFETGFKKISFGGMQNARFLNLREFIGEYSSAKDIAEKLQNMEWE